MNNALLEKAKRIIASLTAEELESKLSAYGIAFTRQVVMFENVAEELPEHIEKLLWVKSDDMVTAFSDEIVYMNFVMASAVNDNSYALAA